MPEWAAEGGLMGRLRRPLVASGVGLSTQIEPRALPARMGEMDRLPDDVLLTVFDLLRDEKLLPVYLTCRRFNNLLDYSSIWRLRIAEEYGHTPRFIHSKDLYRLFGHQFYEVEIKEYPRQAPVDTYFKSVFYDHEVALAVAIDLIDHHYLRYRVLSDDFDSFFSESVKGSLSMMYKVYKHMGRYGGTDHMRPDIYRVYMGGLKGYLEKNELLTMRPPRPHRRGLKSVTVSVQPFTINFRKMGE